MVITITLALVGVGFVLFSVRRRHKAFPPSSFIVGSDIGRDGRARL